MSAGSIKTRRFRDARRADGTIRQEVYLPADLAAAIDEFKHAQRIPARPQAIRQLCELGLKAGALLGAIHDLEAQIGLGVPPTAHAARNPKSSSPESRQ